MEWAFLIITFYSDAMIVLPEKYPMEQCLQIAKSPGSAKRAECIPAPKLTIMKDESRVENFGEKYKDCIMSNNGQLNCPIPDIPSRPSKCKQDGFMMVCPPIYRPN